jgi:hypothetical protein
MITLGRKSKGRGLMCYLRMLDSWDAQKPSLKNNDHGLSSMVGFSVARNGIGPSTKGL